MEEEWFRSPEQLPEIGRRAQREDDPTREYIVTEVSGKPVWHTLHSQEWPHGFFVSRTAGRWRYTTDIHHYLSLEDWTAGVKNFPLAECLDFYRSDTMKNEIPLNKPGDIPFPHSWVQVHIQLPTSNAEEIDKSQAIILENTDALINQLQTTGEINVCVRGCSCDPCTNTAAANFENRKELIKEKARDLIEFDPEILNGLLRDTVGSNAAAQLTPWLKQLGES